MAVFLHQLGRLAFRRRWYVLIGWIVVLGVVGAVAAGAPARPSDSFAIPGTESQQAAHVLQKDFGSNPNNAAAQIVFVAPHGQQVTSAQNRSAVDQALNQLTGGPQVARVTNPFHGRTRTVSKDGSTAYATVNYKVGSSDLTETSKRALQGVITRGDHSGLTVNEGGSALAAKQSGSTIAIGIIIAAIVLLITFGSLAAAGLPLLTAAIGIGISLMAIKALGSTLGLSSTVSTLALMLGLAVGIDYALFIVSRYREERARGCLPDQAAGLAVGTAGSAVVFAGSTVIIGLAGLSVVGIPTLTKMGLAAAAAIAVAVTIALTLVPALLGIFGRGVLPRSVRRRVPRGSVDAPQDPTRRVEAGGIRSSNRGERWARFVVRHPVPVLIAAVVGLAVIAIPATELHLGNPGANTLPTSTTQRRAYDEVSQAFGVGSNGPLSIVVQTKEGSNPQTAAATIARRISATPGVASVSPPRFDAAGNAALISVVSSFAPTAQQTTTLVHAIRAERPALERSTGASYLVGGTTANNIDSAQKVQSALLPYLAVVVGLAFLLLMIVFRSVLVPLKASLGFVLSVLAALGAVVAVFQLGWLAGLLGVQQTGPIMFLMPIFMVGIVFGLAMDYEVFLLTRVREAHVHGQVARQAIATGFRHSARVVVAAALIMTSVFAGFINSDTSLIKMIGFGLAIAVLFDAFVVRMTIVPAVLALLGERAWWLPRWLERILPRVDVEGEALERAIPDGDAHIPVLEEAPVS